MVAPAPFTTENSEVLPLRRWPWRQERGARLRFVREAEARLAGRVGGGQGLPQIVLPLSVGRGGIGIQLDHERHVRRAIQVAANCLFAPAAVVTDVKTGEFWKRFGPLVCVPGVLTVTPSLPRSMPRPPLPEMLLERIWLSLLKGVVNAPLASASPGM